MHTTIGIIFIKFSVHEVLFLFLLGSLIFTQIRTVYTYTYRPIKKFPSGNKILIPTLSYNNGMA